MIKSPSNIATLFSGVLLFLSTLTYGQTVGIQLEGLYATSTALPLDQYAVENVFDGDESTVWKSPKGAGPNEGIMLYFSEPTYVSKISFWDEVSTDLAEIQRLEVYGDGQSFWGGGNIDQTISSLYIKISKTSNTKNIRNEAVNGDNYIRQIFDKNFSIAISEILIFGVDEQTLNILPPTFIQGSIDASSSLNPILAYGSANLMDSRKDFGWAEGQSGNGIGESITFTTTSIIEVDKIKIWNGYQRSSKHYSSNARLKTFEFGLKGSDLVTYSMVDTNQPTYINLHTKVKGNQFILIVKDAYAGSKYKDLVISEIKFFNGKEPIIIKSKAEENRVIATNKKSNPLFSEFIDRNINVSQRTEKRTEKEGEYYAESSWKTQSLNLRSNNTFVLYQSESLSIEEYSEKDNIDNYENENKEVIADGNWELKEETDDYIKVRIFGKIYSPTTQAELYHGDVTSENVRIFQDFLTLKKDKISGERFIDDIPLKY